MHLRGPTSKGREGEERGRREREGKEGKRKGRGNDLMHPLLQIPATPPLPSACILVNSAVEKRPFSPKPMSVCLLDVTESYERISINWTSET